MEELMKKEQEKIFRDQERNPLDLLGVLFPLFLEKKKGENLLSPREDEKEIIISLKIRNF